LPLRERKEKNQHFKFLIKRLRNANNAIEEKEVLSAIQTVYNKGSLKYAVKKAKIKLWLALQLIQNPINRVANKLGVSSKLFYKKKIMQIYKMSNFKKEIDTEENIISNIYNSSFKLGTRLPGCFERSDRPKPLKLR